MQIVVVPILAWIALIDLRTHRIQNRALSILGITSLITIDVRTFTLRGHIYMTVIVLLVAIFLSIFCGLGMGDVKLLGVLAISVLPSEADAYMIFLLTVAVSASAHALFLSRGDLRISLQIPLAPAIFCGTIAALIAK
jgi:Flp pilus assembly protein protease CpaA